MLDSTGLPRATEWLPAGATELKGNAAWAYADLASPNGFGTGDVSVAPSGAATFDDLADLSLSPDASADQPRAAAVNAFAVVNYMHDWLQTGGFDPAAGNAQQDEVPDAGFGNDRTFVEVQDPRVRSNASMTAYPDGQSPVLELGIFTPRRAQRVATDAGVFAGLVSSPTRFPFSVTGRPVLADSPNTPDAGTGCVPYRNRAEVSGNVALIGPTFGCANSAAFNHALDAGAVAVVFASRFTDSLQTAFFAAAPPVPMMSVSQVSYAALVAGVDAGTLGSVTLEHYGIPDVDSAFDESIIAHEYGHLLSGRLVGGGKGNSGLMYGAMSEGWSDFVALLALVRSADGASMWSGAFPHGAFAGHGLAPTGEPDDSWYYGLRRYPYSTDLTKNGLTFKHITRGAMLPAGGTFVSSDNAEAHNAGEVWASALWEGYAALQREARHPFDEVRQNTLVDLVAGMKATPAGRIGFLDARDALLAVVAARDAADLPAWLGAFAKRGMGLDAKQPGSDSFDLSGVVEDTSATGARLVVLSVTTDDAQSACDHDGIIGPGETATLNVKVLNRGAVMLTGVNVGVSTSTTGAMLGATSLPLASLPPFGAATLSVPLTLARRFDGTVVKLVFSPRGGALGTADIAWDLRAARRELPSYVESWIGESPTWSVDSVPAGQLSNDEACDVIAAPDADQLLHCPNVPHFADEVLDSPQIQVGQTPLKLKFKHAWSFDDLNGNFYDGLVLQVRVLPATAFTAVAPATLMPAYPGSIYASSGATLKGQPAWVGSSPGFPALVDQSVDLGTQYAGKTVQFRFRMSTDVSAGKAGWYFDEFSVEGATTPPFIAFIRDEGACGNKAPVVVAGADFSADEGTVVTLPLTSATDPDGDTVTGSWSQVSGMPSVTVTSGSFTAPAAAKGESVVLGFRYTASDGKLSGSDDVTVTVRHVNLPPVVNAFGPQSVEPGATAEVRATATDRDGDIVTFTWRQVRGPTVTLSSSTAATVTFTAPEENVTLEVTADDGTAQSTATVEVPVVKPPGKCGCGSAPTALISLVALVAGRFFRRRRDRI